MKYFFFAFLFTLIGCASNPTSLSKDYALSNSSNKGLVAISLVNEFEGVNPAESHIYYGIKINYKNIASNITGTFEGSGILMSPAEGLISLNDRMDHMENPYGILIVKELDAGEYKISAPAPKSNGFVEYSMPPREARFIVKSGEITYLGEYGINVRKSSVPRAYVRNASDRDIGTLRKKFPNIDHGKVFYAVSPMDKTYVTGKPIPQKQLIYIPAVRYKK
tara:strand:- start:1320 stop:1982 length:663 start_codon:yes stop_codon:yes gene_type:complete